jgi:hypothetical protein
MSSFDSHVHCDELTDYRPTEADLAEYAAWCDEQANAANAWQDARMRYSRAKMTTYGMMRP